LILDNGTTAMTGLQEHPGTGRLLDQTPANRLDYETIARAMNVPNIGTFDPLRQSEEFEAALVEALGKDELTVLIVRRPCILSVVRNSVKPA